MARIRIAWKSGEVNVTLRDTPTARALLAVLPVEASANTWGEEVYFTLPMSAKLEAGATQVVEPGTVCFWVQGQALALPFGATPVSNGNECRLVTPCNIVGQIDGNPRRLAGVRDGDAIRVAPVKP
jgi:hypothetical protein